MQVSVEATGNIERKLSIVVPADRIDGEVGTRLKSMRGRVKIDGFRPGKVPMNIVNQQYGDSVRQDVTNELIQSTFHEAIEQEKLTVAGMPKIEVTTLASGKDLEYIATLDIYPEFEVGDISKIEVKKLNFKLTTTDVNDMIQTLRKQSQQWKEVQRTAKKDDLLVIDFNGKINGEEFEGCASQNVSVEIGAGQILADFENALEGMKPDEEKETDVTFPEDYPEESLRGKTAQYTLKVNTISEAELPEIDEEFIKKFGVTDGSEEQFKAEIKANMQREADQRAKSQLKQSVMDGLSELHEIDLPSSLVENEITQVRNEMQQNIQGADMSSLPDKMFEDQASRRVKLGLIVGEIITKNQLEKDQAKVDVMLNSLTQSYEDPQAVAEYYKTNEQVMQSIEAAVMEEMVVDWVLEKARIIEEKVNFTELMKAQA